MINLIKNLFNKENKCLELEKENAELKAKLVEKQDVINKTNAYWKKKLYNAQKTSKKKL